MSKQKMVLNKRLRHEALKESLVGWFRFTSRPAFIPNVPSIQDHSIDDLLRRLLPDNVVDMTDLGQMEEAPFVFLSLSSSFNEDCRQGINGFDRTLFQLKRLNDERALAEKIDLIIPNLGNTEAAKRYTPPMAVGDGPNATKFEKSIVEKQGNFLADLTRYGSQRMQHCKGVFENFVALYEEAEGPLRREIFELEKKLERSDRKLVDVALDDTQNNNDDDDATQEIKTNDESNSNRGIFSHGCDVESLPSPSIEDARMTEQLWDSEDVVPETQYDSSAEDQPGIIKEEEERVKEEERRSETKDEGTKNEGKTGEKDEGTKIAGKTGEKDDGLFGFGEEEEESAGSAKRKRIKSGLDGSGDDNRAGNGKANGETEPNADSAKGKGKGKNRKGGASAAAKEKSGAADDDGDRRGGGGGGGGEQEGSSRKRLREREKSPSI